MHLCRQQLYSTPHRLRAQISRLCTLLTAHFAVADNALWAQPVRLTAIPSSRVVQSQKIECSWHVLSSHSQCSYERDTIHATLAMGCSTLHASNLVSRATKARRAELCWSLFWHTPTQDHSSSVSSRSGIIMASLSMKPQPIIPNSTIAGSPDCRKPFPSRTLPSLHYDTG